MRCDFITIFPEFFVGPLDHGILRRAREAGIVQVQVQDLRAFTKDRHRTVDDRPFGGGEGMVLKPEPLFEAVESLLGHGLGDSAAPRAAQLGEAIVLLSAAGKPFDQQAARRFAKLQRLIFLCGRYEGVDERVADHLATDEISVGDFVLSGGELAALLVVDAVTRLLPGALGNEASTQNESFNESLSSVAESSHLEMPRARHSSEAMDYPRNLAPLGPPRTSCSPSSRGLLLDFPHYTRPAEYRGWRVPEVLISGNHAEVAKWRRTAALEKTRRNRPDLL